MAVPTIDSITPTAGWTGGRQLVEISGTGFSLPAAPPPGPTDPPTPSMQVTFGGVVCPAVWVVSSTLLRVLTPIHDPSGVRSRPSPEEADLPASDVVVQNLDAGGDPVPGEVATLAATYSFQRPLLDASTYTSRAIDQLIVELKRQVHPNVAYSPHTDWDAETGDGLNLVELATLPGIGLTGLRLPTSRDIGDREQPEVGLGDGTFAVRAQPVVRDAVLTCVGVSDNQRELAALELAVKVFARDNTSLVVADPQGGTLEYTLNYQRGEPVTVVDRQAGVQWFQSEFVIRRIVEPEMPGVAAGSAVREIGYVAERFNTNVG